MASTSKTSASPPPVRAPAAIGRHLGGWQSAAAIALGVAVAAWVAVPQATEPSDLPLVTPDRRELAALTSTAEAREERARAQPLPFEVRAVGETLRQLGLANAERPTSSLQAELAELRVRTTEALAKRGPEPLLDLRALQETLFSDAVARFEETGTADTELKELAGNFADKAGENGWLRNGRFVFEDDELRVMFRLRWSKLTGLDRLPAFRPRGVELLLYHRALLEHPDSRDAFPRNQLLGSINALSELDPSYPGALARGIVLYRSGDMEAALTAFRSYVDHHPTGPWVRRAEGYLLATAERMPPP
jgi:hypothetical protein